MTGIDLAFEDMYTNGDHIRECDGTEELVIMDDHPISQMDQIPVPSRAKFNPASGIDYSIYN